MKSFASDKGVLKIVDVVQISERGKTKNVNVYIEAPCIALLCLPLQDQKISGVFNENYNYLKDPELSDDYNDATDKSVDLLIGLNFYFNFVTDKVYQRPPSRPVAVDSTLGWILCGPTEFYFISSISYAN